MLRDPLKEILQKNRQLQIPPNDAEKHTASVNKYQVFLFVFLCTFWRNQKPPNFINKNAFSYVFILTFNVRSSDSVYVRLPDSARLLSIMATHARFSLSLSAVMVLLQASVVYMDTRTVDIGYTVSEESAHWPDSRSVEITPTMQGFTPQGLW